MKKLILSSLVLALMPFALQAQDVFADMDKTNSSANRDLIRFRPVQENPNQMSVRVAGYELLLERDTKDTLHPVDEVIDVIINGGYKKSRRPYGGRIGTWEFGNNGFRKASNAYAMYPANEKGFMELDVKKSNHITWNWVTLSTSFTRRNVLGLTMAIGFTWNNYVFETRSRYAKIDGMIHPVESETDLKKAKLSTFALHIPLALEINPSRSFFISLGGYVDMVGRSRLKSKFPKQKLWNPYTNYLQAGVTVRAGFRNIYVFGNYGLTEMFKDGRGPALNPYTFGCGFGF
jgi:hypothetical protein